MLWPMGWDNPETRDACGEESGQFLLGTIWFRRTSTQKSNRSVWNRPSLYGDDIRYDSAHLLLAVLGLWRSSNRESHAATSPPSQRARRLLHTRIRKSTTRFRQINLSTIVEWWIFQLMTYKGIQYSLQISTTYDDSSVSLDTSSLFPFSNIYIVASQISLISIEVYILEKENLNNDAVKNHTLRYNDNKFRLFFAA